MTEAREGRASKKQKKRSDFDPQEKTGKSTVTALLSVDSGLIVGRDVASRVQRRFRWLNVFDVETLENVLAVRILV